MTGRRCAVLGSPIGHSLSPALHGAAYAELGLDWVYEAREVTADGLADFLDGLDSSWRGLSLTMPLKRSVVPLLDELAGSARQALAVNTVLLGDGRRTGYNTDVPGLSAALRERYAGPVATAVVVGGGATAASALLGLADLGCRAVTLFVRDVDRAKPTVDTAARHPGRPQVDVRLLGSGPVPADVLVSTVPAWAQSASVLTLADPVRAVFDVIYDPWPTPLGALPERGRVWVSGLDLLVHQAALQVELMTGVDRAPLAVMRRAGEDALARRAASSADPLP